MIGYFEEDAGVKSMTRLLTFIATLTGVAVALAGVAFIAVSLPGLPVIELGVGLAGLGLGTKIGGRFLENKSA